MENSTAKRRIQGENALPCDRLPFGKCFFHRLQIFPIQFVGCLGGGLFGVLERLLIFAHGGVPARQSHVDRPSIAIALGIKFEYFKCFFLSSLPANRNPCEPPQYFSWRSAYLYF
jgi:hypothetical protein